MNATSQPKSLSKNPVLRENERERRSPRRSQPFTARAALRWAVVSLVAVGLTACGRGGEDAGKGAKPAGAIIQNKGSAAL